MELFRLGFNTIVHLCRLFPSSLFSGGMNPPSTAHSRAELARLFFGKSGPNWDNLSKRQKKALIGLNRGPVRLVIRFVSWLRRPEQEYKLNLSSDRRIFVHIRHVANLKGQISFEDTP